MKCAKHYRGAGSASHQQSSASGTGELWWFCCVELHCYYCGGEKEAVPTHTGIRRHATHIRTIYGLSSGWVSAQCSDLDPSECLSSRVVAAGGGTNHAIKGKKKKEKRKKGEGHSQHQSWGTITRGVSLIESQRLRVPSRATAAASAAERIVPSLSDLRPLKSPRSDGSVARR